MELCVFGCGQEAKYVLKNGKPCCSETHNGCPKRKEQARESGKINSHTKRVCSICGDLFSIPGFSRHKEKCGISKIRIRYCDICGEILPFRQKVCLKCKESSKVPCKNCGRPVTKERSFCSSKCCGAYHKRLKEREIEKGISSNPRIIKAYLIKNRGIRCEICGISTWTGSPVPLVMDHIDGNPTNNSLSNLRLICGNCDMLLPTFAGKNKGNGRYYRRERYKNFGYS